MNADGTDKSQVADDADGFRDYTPKLHAGRGPYRLHTLQAARRRLRDLEDAGRRHRQASPHAVHRTAPGNEAVDFGLSVSPDGKRVAFARFDADGFAARLFVMGIDGSNPHPVTPPRLEGLPRTGRPTANGSPSRATAHGQGRASTRCARRHGPQRLTPDSLPAQRLPPSYSPAGNQIAFGSDRNYPDVMLPRSFAIGATAPRAHDRHGLSAPGILCPSWGTAPLIP